VALVLKFKRFVPKLIDGYLTDGTRVDFADFNWVEGFVEEFNV